MAYKAVVFLGRRNDGAVPTIEAMAGADPTQMALKANALPTQHDGCEVVELRVDHLCFTSTTHGESPPDLAERIRRSGDLFDATGRAA